MKEYVCDYCGFDDDDDAVEIGDGSIACSECIQNLNPIHGEGI